MIKEAGLPASATLIGMLVLGEPLGLTSVVGLLLVAAARSWGATSPRPSAHR